MIFFRHSDFPNLPEPRNWWVVMFLTSPIMGGSNKPQARPHSFQNDVTIFRDIDLKRRLQIHLIHLCVEVNCERFYCRHPIKRMCGVVTLRFLLLPFVDVWNVLSYIRILLMWETFWKHSASDKDEPSRKLSIRFLNLLKHLTSQYLSWEQTFSKSL